ncbi:helix-turn-helix transcriptional regulator [Pantoea ananatis]|uniref:helix-turn-helix transcriptional regulator n=3 Tax=Pantoea ananas TaxID=553 RepID=UPI000CF559CF|nr:AraC family transcriptional regulator [Pantoea ananatis]PQK94527.1 AraC family transcriptional regulator [Pantoea ananatis]PXV97466.1 AraC family transcriptional regulator [Pantoea ananatis]
MAERNISFRAGIGSTAHVLQVQPLLARNIIIDEPTVILVRQGSKCIRTGEKELVINPGEAVIVGEGESFDITNIPAKGGSYEADWLSFNTSLVKNYTRTNCNAAPVTGVHKLEGASESFRRAFYHTREVFTDSADIPEAIAVVRMREMLSWLDEYGLCFGYFQRAGIGNKIRKIISADASHGWNINEVSCQLGMSEATLRRRLTAEKTSFSQLIADVRMCRALTLLQVTDLSVTQIAYEVGYVSPSKFSARFRNRFGFCPGQVRTLKNAEQLIPA